MHSSQIPFWRIIAHMLGFHWWGELRYWEVDDPSADIGTYRVCEICGEEKVIQAPY